MLYASKTKTILELVLENGFHSWLFWKFVISYRILRKRNSKQYNLIYFESAPQSSLIINELASKVHHKHALGLVQA